jgi:hypothetical protein
MRRRNAIHGPLQMDTRSQTHCRAPRESVWARRAGGRTVRLFGLVEGVEQPVHPERTAQAECLPNGDFGVVDMKRVQ